MTSYKHVGTFNPVNTGLGLEVTTKAGAILGQTETTAVEAFCVTIHTVGCKTEALQAFMLSSQLFQCRRWPTLRKTEYQRCRASLIRAHKLVAKDA